MYAERCTAVRYNAPLKTCYEHLLAAGKHKKMALVHAQAADDTQRHRQAGLHVESCASLHLTSKTVAQGKALAQQRLANASCVHPFEAFMRHEQ